MSFLKQLGSGTGEGFSPRLYPDVYALLAVWRSRAAAEAGARDAPAYLRRRARCQENWTIFLEPISTRGRWSGAAPFEAPETAPPPVGEPIAALTRATIRPSRSLRFWAHEPAISERIGRDANVLFKIGLGEAPFLRQATFSIWPDLASLDAFARAPGPHAEAIRAVRREKLFAEELYARFRVVGEEGRWSGAPPLAAIRTSPHTPTSPPPVRTPAAH